jgi:hypothetical protein
MAIWISVPGVWASPGHHMDSEVHRNLPWEGCCLGSYRDSGGRRHRAVSEVDARWRSTSVTRWRCGHRREPDSLCWAARRGCAVPGVVCRASLRRRRGLGRSPCQPPATTAGLQTRGTEAAADEMVQPPPLPLDGALLAIRVRLASSTSWEDSTLLHVRRDKEIGKWERGVVREGKEQ